MSNSVNNEVTGETSNTSMNSESTVSTADVVELLGLIAFAELSAQMRLAVDAALSPTPEHRLAHADLSAQAHARMLALTDLVDELGFDGRAQVIRYNDSFSDYESRTRSQTWHERVLKGYVGHSVAVDFCKLVSTTLPQTLRERIEPILHNTNQSENAAEILTAKAQSDPTLASRLALWGRRLVGEALNQIQGLVITNPALERLVIAAAELAGTNVQAADLEEGRKLEIAWVFSQLTADHARRMDKIGLAA